MDPVPGAVLAVDFGHRRIGLAVSDALRVSVRPLGFVARTTDEEAAATVAAVALRERAALVVVGIPRHADGRTAPATRIARDFARTLAKRCTMPIAECDERHSSQEAEDLLRRSGRWPAAPGVLDAESAAVILRRYLAEGA